VQALDARVEKAEGNFQQKISDHSARILDLLRRVILKQKDMQLKISGNLEISDTSLPVTADVTPVSTLRPTEGARKRAVSVPGAAAAQARRRKALDELLHELDSLEKESN
jgi:hypothetical protein